MAGQIRVRIESSTSCKALVIKKDEVLFVQIQKRCRTADEDGTRKGLDDGRHWMLSLLNKDEFLQKRNCQKCSAPVTPRQGQCEIQYNISSK